MSDLHGFPINRHAETIGHLQTQQGLYGVITAAPHTQETGNRRACVSV